MDNEDRRQRSGDYSTDRRFNPEALFDVIESADSSEQATSAIQQFVSKGDGDQLRQAIALYTRSARARGKSIENVLADLNALSDRHQERYAHTGELLTPSALKKLVLRTVLDGFGSDGEAEKS